MESPRDGDWQGSIKWWEATHSHASEYNVPRHTRREKARLCEIWPNLKTSIKRKKHPICLLICAAPGSPRSSWKSATHIFRPFWSPSTGHELHILKISAREWARGPCAYINIYMYDCVSASALQKKKGAGAKRRDEKWRAFMAGPASTAASRGLTWSANRPPFHRRCKQEGRRREQRAMKEKFQRRRVKRVKDA